MREPLEEYFQHGIKIEVIRLLREIVNDDLNRHIVALILKEACCRNNTEREFASDLLVEFVATGLGQIKSIHDGLDIVLKDLDDLALDTPDIDQVVAKFIARGIADEIVTPKFIQKFDVDGKSEKNKLRKCIKKAKGLTNTTQGLARLEHVWGISARSPVRQISRKIKLILKEYLSVGSITETSICIRELQSKQFHHEVVYNMVLLGIESGDFKTIQMLVSLLQALGSSGENLISDYHLKGGLDRILRNIDDIVLDVPHAKRHLASFYRLAAPCIPSQLKLTNEKLYPDGQLDVLDAERRSESRKRSISLTAEQQIPLAQR